MNSNLDNIEFVLNHELMQFTKGKTEKTLQTIAERHLHRMHDDAHSIDIIITNNNLQETEQWKIRTNQKFKGRSNIDINVLSSKKGDKNHTNVSTLISQMAKGLNLNNYSMLPSVIIMCCHSKRVEHDCVELLESFCNNEYIRFNFVFDESDANLGTVSTFLHSINNNHNNIHKCIDSIEFVTATPFEDFWRMLSQHGIYKLINRDHFIEESYEDLFRNYREFEEHMWTTVDNDTMNPLEYIKDCFQQGLIPTRRNIIFAPGHVFSEKKDVGSHEEIVEYFLSKAYTVLLHNGKNKCFCDVDGSRLSIDDFNRRHSIVGELRDTLRRWNALHPNQNLAITGNWTIERGVTFNTNGFNFTHMIISMLHGRKLNRLLQILGRANGHKQYVERMNIISPKAIELTAKAFVATLKEVRIANPQMFNPTDFSSKKTGIIPVRVHLRDEDYRLVLVSKLTGKKNYAINVHNAIKEGIQLGYIALEDRNNIHKFDINTCRLKNIRKFCNEQENKDNRRFLQFSNAFERHNASSQQCSKNQYCLDITLIDYVKDDFTNKKNIAWITFNI
jgi:hypothetical protein